jgi:NAD-dependent SIR2 family protein deacetylase
MPESQTTTSEMIEKAADLIRQTRTLIITAGAGMGVDSGLPDFRGDQGFWQAYPAYEKLGLKFMQIATPRHFAEDPELAWGFYGHRANLYTDTVPHAGFATMLEWISKFDLASYVVTSNVDGHFQKAGFPADRIVEIHGSIHHMQCQAPCKPEIWEHKQRFDIDESTMRSSTLPQCKFCSQIARPNILMFNDWWWIPVRSNGQQKRLDEFVKTCPKPMTVVEFGAGRAIPTIRHMSESLARQNDGRVIRINLREAQIAEPHVSIFDTAAVTVSRIDQLLT